MNLKTIHNVYFVGIGGIGMSALARYFNFLGKKVAGYDKTKSKITDSLEELSISICFDDKATLISDNFRDVENTLVVYTPAIPDSHEQLSYFNDNGFLVQKRAETLGLITKDTFCFAVAGTHGKTTTSAILGHILKSCNADMTAFLGGITENYKSNLIVNGSAVSVVEADEFDRSFMQLSPDVACITSMDADHLDIYGEAAALQQTFVDFADLLPESKKLFVAPGVGLKGITYGINSHTDYAIKDIRIKDGSYYMTIKTPKEEIEDVVFHLPGEHNLLNALVAFAMAYDYGYDTKQLVAGLNTFKGVERRFSYQLKTQDLVYIDDYAHHPTEINAVYNAVSEMYPGKKVMAIFQPHLFSRTNDFADDFAKSLSQFDEVRLLDIYPARELPIGGVTSAWLLSKIENVNKKCIHKSEILNEIKNSDVSVVLTIGAGDIGAEVARIKKGLVDE